MEAALAGFVSKRTLLPTSSFFTIFSLPISKYWSSLACLFINLSPQSFHRTTPPPHLLFPSLPLSHPHHLSFHVSSPPLSRSAFNLSALIIFIIFSLSPLCLLWSPPADICHACTHMMPTFILFAWRKRQVKIIKRSRCCDRHIYPQNQDTDSKP